MDTFVGPRWFALALTSLLLASPAQAQPSTWESRHRDADLTIECRKLFLEDPVLGPLNLGVRVKERVAVLWGPAPSREVVRRAEQCLQTIVELMDVKSEMIILPHIDWTPLPGLPAAAPNAAPPAEPAPVLPDPVRPVAPRVGLQDQAEVARR
jgi:hypothetical protein